MAENSPIRVKSASHAKHTGAFPFGKTKKRPGTLAPGLFQSSCGTNRGSEFETHATGDEVVVFAELARQFETQVVGHMEDEAGIEDPAILVDPEVIGRHHREILLAEIALAAHEERLCEDLETTGARPDTGSDIVGPGVIVEMRVVLILGVRVLGPSFEGEVDAFGERNSGTKTEAVAVRADIEELCAPIIVVAPVRVTAGEEEIRAERLGESDPVKIALIGEVVSEIENAVFEIDEVLGKTIVTLQGGQGGDLFSAEVSRRSKRGGEHRHREGNNSFFHLVQTGFLKKVRP
jgi:hypothetical protein